MLNWVDINGLFNVEILSELMLYVKVKGEYELTTRVQMKTSENLVAY